MISPSDAGTAASDTSQREAPICGAIKEPLVFWLWSRMAPRAKPTRATRHAHVEAVSFTTGDGKNLSGYRIRAHYERDKPVEPKGYVLMALGNAMIADQMIGELAAYAQAGYDAYIYDYRGYGLSEGKRRINAIIEDYREIVADLNSNYDRKMLYGVSLGGMVMMNAIGSGVEFDAAVIDSAPSRLSSYGCPDRIDPVNQLTERNAPKLLVITGKRDQVLGPKDTREFRKKAGAMGAKTVDGEDFAHPYMDRAYDVHLQRVRLVQEHLLPSGASSR
jgi:alpha/beta superfamily hydrolase